MEKFNDNTVTLSVDFSSKFKQRWSAPCHSAWQNTLQAGDLIRAGSKREMSTPFTSGTEKHAEAIATTTAEPSGDSSSTASTIRPSEEQSGGWKPSYFRVGPVIGLAALLLALLQIFASFAVLKLSHGHAIVDWKVGWKFDPSVYIAVLTTISNGAIQLAASQGAVITLWLRLLRGTTLGQLHRDFVYGSEFYDALRSGKHINLLAIACIFATIVCMDGALLQRASSTQSISYSGPVNLNVSVVPEVPSYWSGLNELNTGNAGFSSGMLPVINQYNSKIPITDGIQGCTGSCSATIRAPALVPYRCQSEMVFKNFSAPLAPHDPMRQVFYTSLTSIYGPVETLDFHTYLTEDAVAESCAGPVNSTHCYLRSAIAEYEVLVSNETITLVDPANPTFISWANNTALTNQTISANHLHESNDADVVKTTLAGIVSAFNYDFEFSGQASPPDPQQPNVLYLNFIGNEWFAGLHTTNYEQYNNNEACTYTWNDVRPATMAGLNELMFRIGVQVAQTYDEASLKDLLDPGVQTNYSVTGTLQSHVEVFKSDFAFFSAAAAVELLTILLVLSTFYGYWRLGRRVSFSPLEIAKAFGAVLLARAGSNSSGEEIAKLLDDEPIQYALLYSDYEPVETDRRVGTLTISNQENVHQPRSGTLCV